jgi:hypothetical protein
MFAQLIVLRVLNQLSFGSVLMATEAGKIAPRCHAAGGASPRQSIRIVKQRVKAGDTEEVAQQTLIANTNTERDTPRLGHKIAEKPRPQGGFCKIFVAPLASPLQRFPFFA